MRYQRLVVKKWGHWLVKDTYTWHLTSHTLGGSCVSGNTDAPLSNSLMYVCWDSRLRCVYMSDIIFPPQCPIGDQESSTTAEGEMHPIKKWSKWQFSQPLDPLPHPQSTEEHVNGSPLNRLCPGVPSFPSQSPSPSLRLSLAHPQC